MKGFPYRLAQKIQARRPPKELVFNVNGRKAVYELGDLE